MNWRSINKIFFLILTVSIITPRLSADEGMWIPLLLKDRTIDEMEAMGFQLSADEIYSMNQSSMKDAVVLFGRGCTGEIISEKGLLITNHHCGFSSIQSHSTVESDYLTNGFWAKEPTEELPNQGLTVSILDRMVDVTSRILDDIPENSTELERQKLIDAAERSIIEKVENKSPFVYATIRSFFHNKQYFLFVYTVYRDVRLVGAPPSSIGKFGGDTDNWMWPRHTGDFALFRIYVDENNNPAHYSPSNVPYKPRHHFPISLKGYSEGDFTMVYGFPGSTERYITSHELKIILNKELPQNIQIRDKRLEIMADIMDSDPALRIKFATQYARTSNSWKKWKGMIRGLERADAMLMKQNSEQQFLTWVNQDAERQNVYGGLFDHFESTYNRYEVLYLAQNFRYETILASDLLDYADLFVQLINQQPMGNQKGVDELLEKAKSRLEGFYKSYYQPLDQKTLPFLLSSYMANVNERYIPPVLTEGIAKFDGDMETYCNALFESTVLLNPEKLGKLLNDFDDKAAKKLRKDKVVELKEGFMREFYLEVYPQLSDVKLSLDSLYRVYMGGLMEMYPDSVFMANANGTLRVTFGKIAGYEPRDAVYYRPFTTLQGVIEKVDPDIYDYDVPQKLIDLYNAKNYGRYAGDDTMHVCFIARNHTSGGNSGSPVINAEGHLIGVNFDRNWEGTMSDIYYDPSQCRNISLDIRYALFIIDKFAGAGYLIEEMSLVE